MCKGCQAEIHYGKKWFSIFLAGILFIYLGYLLDSWIEKLLPIAIGLVCIAIGIMRAKDKEPYFKRINKTDRS